MTGKPLFIRAAFIPSTHSQQSSRSVPFQSHITCLYFIVKAVRNFGQNNIKWDNF